MKKNKMKAPVIFYIAVLVLCLTMISTSLSGGFFAKYVTQVQDTDAARVAKYDVTVSDLAPDNLVLDSYDPNKLEGNMDFTVTSNSEVAIKYSVIVTLPAPLPTEYVRDAATGELSETPEPYMFITLKDKGDAVGTTVRQPQVSDGNLVLTFADVGSFAPGSFSATHSLVAIVFPGDHEGNTYTISNLKVRVLVEQID